MSLRLKLYATKIILPMQEEAKLKARVFLKSGKKSSRKSTPPTGQRSRKSRAGGM